jgi:Protein of unknown function (DUF2752)
VPRTTELDPGRQLGLYWGGVAAALVTLSPLGPRLAHGLPVCTFKALFGIPCPTCGATRAALALARFDLAGAFARSPLAAAAWVALIAGGLVAGVAALLGHGVPELPNRLPWWARLGVVALVLANWAYLIATGA